MSYLTPSIVNRQDILGQLWKKSNLSTKNKPSTPQPKPIETIPLFALLIGINVYQASSVDPNFPTLRGAVPDALDMKFYLENNLGVPTDQITTLTDENATRASIVNALRDLRDDDRINLGDAILIYYAGHGVEMDSPPNWEAGGPNAKIQAIVPYDCDVLKSGGRVAPLFDHILEVLLSRVAEKKGDNITAIFDCCHASSATRGASGDDLVQVRSVELPSRVYPEQLDQDILNSEPTTRGAYTPSAYKYRGLGSHILLAACGPSELAVESNGHGRFSAALLKLLREVSPERLRYSDVLSHPLFDRIPEQKPQCEGNHLGRILFNSKVISSQRRSFSVSYNKKANHGHGQYIVNGGTMHNITTESQFAVYRESDVQLTAKISTLHVDQLRPFTFTAKLAPGAPAFDLAHPTIAIQTRIGPREDLQIMVSPEDSFRRIYRDLVNHPALKVDAETISLVEQSDAAHVEIRSLTSDNVVELILRTISVANIPSHQFPRLVDATDSDILAGTISRIAHFYRELKYVDNNPRLSQYIDVEFYKLDSIYETDENTGLEEEQLEPIGPNLYVNGMVMVTVSDEDGEDVPYGIKLTNRSARNLHVNMFFFNNSDLTITAFVKPHASVNGNSLEVPLKSRGHSLAIGYGAGGHQPMSFEIADGLDVDVGFLKIYLSTQPVNMMHIPQASPFLSTRAYREYRPPRRLQASWTDILIPVVQRRRG